MPRSHPTIDRASVIRLWLHRQGLASPRGDAKLDRRALVDHLERTGALQLDSINVVDRAHYLTLWSRFGTFDRERVDRWIYRERLGYEYWGHEASILPISHLPLGRRRMRRFPPASWRRASWWRHYEPPLAAKRRVLRRLRLDGPLESADFEADAAGTDHRPRPGGTMPLPKENKRALQVLWHAGRLAVRERRHFRRVYDLAERVYPPSEVASTSAYEDSWLLIGLSGNGIASEAHLMHYVSAPKLDAARRRRVIARNLAQKRIVELRVQGQSGPYYSLPACFDELDDLAAPRGTTLLCPFDSLLWQRRRAEELFGFRYRIEIYVPPGKRRYGYYVLPILHDGVPVGRLDPKLHRDRGRLEIKSIHIEPGFREGRSFRRGLARALRDLATFVGAGDLRLPGGWGRKLR